MSRGITYNEYVACDLPENRPYDRVVIKCDDDMDDSSTTTASENASIQKQ